MISVILALCYVLLSLCVFMLIRNEFVYRARIAILDIEPVVKGLRLHRSLPKYDEMMCQPKFWTLWTASHWLTWIERSEANEYEEPK